MATSAAAERISPKGATSIGSSAPSPLSNIDTPQFLENPDFSDLEFSDKEETEEGT